VREREREGGRERERERQSTGGRDMPKKAHARKMPKLLNCMRLKLLVYEALSPKASSY
jgi:hypothetical protein